MKSRIVSKAWGYGIFLDIYFLLSLLPLMGSWVNQWNKGASDSSLQWMWPPMSGSYHEEVLFLKIRFRWKQLSQHVVLHLFCSFYYVNFFPFFEVWKRQEYALIFIFAIIPRPPLSILWMFFLQLQELPKEVKLNEYPRTVEQGGDRAEAKSIIKDPNI